MKKVNKYNCPACEKIYEMMSLIDGAKPIVEIFETISPAQKKWKEGWIKRAVKVCNIKLKKKRKAK